MFKKEKKIKEVKKQEKVVKDTKPAETSKVVKHREANFSVFQVVIFAFLFVLMLWIIGFLTLELDTQKQKLQTLDGKLETLKSGGEGLLDTYIDKIKELQQIDIKEQVQALGVDVKDNIKDVKESMFNKNDLQRVERKIRSLEEYNNTYRGTNLLMLTSSIMLRDAVNRGEAFESELSTLAFIGANNPDIVNGTIVLKEVSKTAVKPFYEIRDNFDKIADEIVFVSNNPMGDNPSVFTKFLVRLKSLFQVRKVVVSNNKDAALATPDDIVATVEKLLKERNLAAALAKFEELENVSEEGFKKAEDWYRDAKLKLEVDNVIEPIVNFSMHQALNDIGRENIKNSIKINVGKPLSKATILEQKSVPSSDNKIKETK